MRKRGKKSQRFCSYSSNIRAVGKAKQKHSLFFTCFSLQQQTASGGDQTSIFPPPPPWTFLLRISVAMVYVLGQYDIFFFKAPISGCCFILGNEEGKKKAGHGQRLGLACSVAVLEKAPDGVVVPKKGLIYLFPPSP